MKYLKVRDVKSPTRGTNGSAGIDLYVPNIIPYSNDIEFIDDKTIVVKPNQSILIPSGLKFNVPSGTALIAMNKSGVAVKKNLLVGACVIDEDYLGEVHIDLKNVGDRDVTITAGEKIIQLLCVDVNYVSLEESDNELDCFGDKIEFSDRGTGGFGSTGTH